MLSNHFLCLYRFFSWLLVEYLIIRPLAGYEPGEMNFGRQWKPTIKGMDIGHRGAGYARRTDK